MGCGQKAAAEEQEEFARALAELGTTAHALERAAGGLYSEVVLRAAREDMTFEGAVLALIDERFRRACVAEKIKFQREYSAFKELSSKFGDAR